MLHPSHDQSSKGLHIKIDKGERGNNKASVAMLVRYLEKEDKARQPPTKALFFDQHQKDIPSQAVVAAIDGNTSKLGKRDEKYFMVTISPSVRELRHLGEDPDKLVAYAREVMACYAASFQRNVQHEDLVYFGKVERRRHFTGRDVAVQAGHVRSGMPKPGPNMHVHVMVSRKDQSGRRKLSPHTNHRKATGTFQGGFDKCGFFQAAQERFDALFQYPRLQHERFGYHRGAQQMVERLDPVVVPLQRMLFRAQRDRPSLALFALRLQREGIGMRFHTDAQGLVSQVSYHILPKALPKDVPAPTSPALDAQQAGLLLERGYTDVLSKAEQTLRCRGKLLLVRAGSGLVRLGFRLERRVPAVFAQRRLSAGERAQLLELGHTEYLEGFFSRQGVPFGARLYYDERGVLQLSMDKGALPARPQLARASEQEAAQFRFPKSFMGVELTDALQAQLRAGQETEVIQGLVYRYKLDDQLHLSRQGMVGRGMPVWQSRAYVIYDQALAPAWQLPGLLSGLSHRGGQLRKQDVVAVQQRLEKEQTLTACDEALVRAVTRCEYKAVREALQQGASKQIFDQEEWAKFPAGLRAILERPAKGAAPPPLARTSYWPTALLAFFRRSAQLPTSEAPSKRERLRKKRRKSLELHLEQR